MGIETAIIGGALGGMLLSGMQKAPNIPAPETPKPPPQPQAAKAPDAASALQGNAGTGQAGGAPGIASTFLTGPGGIDPMALQLGRNTLLGGSSKMG